MPTLPQRHYAEHPEAGAAREGGLPLRDLFTILRRRRRMIFSVVVLFTSVATLAGLQVTPTYTATALVMIEPRESRIVDLEQVVQGLAADDATIETQIRVIQSRETLVRAVDKLDLVADTAFVADQGAADGRPLGVLALLPDGLVDSLPEGWLIAAGIANEPAVAAEPDPEALRERAANGLRDGLKVTQSGRSYVLNVSFTATDPSQAMRVVNGLTDAYIEGQLDRKLVTTKRASSWLAERVEELRERVLESEEAVQEYRASRGLVDTQGGTLDGQQLAALTAQLINTRAERTTKEAKLRQLQELRRSDQGYESSAEVMTSPLIIDLRQRRLQLLREEAQLSREYGERHPLILQLQAEKDELAARIDLEIQNVINSLESEVAVARSREQAIKASLDEAKGESASTGRASVQLRQLEREAAANRSLYEAFLIRLKETEEQQRIVQADARIISPAEPPDAPSSPSPKLFIAGGFAASLVLGAVLALLREQLDDSLRTGQQVEDLLQVPTLGLLPKVTGLKRKERLHSYLMDRPRSAYAEGVRALYAQVRMANTDRPPKVILVTSALPGEGKTSLATSLAAFAAQLGQRTLLIDLDLRRPRVSQEFDLRPEADIVEVASGEALLEDVVHQDEQTGLEILPAVNSYSNPTAVLTSQGLSAVLQLARERYALVIIDTPPVLGVTDAKMLVPQVDAVAFVIRWEKTKREAAQAAIKELRDMAANVLGAALNQADMKRHARYGYGDAGQYYGKYTEYYIN